ncbi:MAG: LPD5 domain-containing protein, partial [Gammaproteobacteria bacterium]|nr:LPD5 domain-containing protein [Gammaproteobacteria bacterium]
TDPKVLAEQIKPYLDEKVDKPQMKFEVRGRNGSYFINKKGDPEYTRLATFDSSKEAFDFIRNNNSKLVESWESHKARVNVTKADIRNKVNKPRTGEDYRNGKNATAEDFQNTFGIKRGTFGKWVKQGKERQDMLNGTYDALMDLANITGVPPRALSLEGKLGFAFGANGRGKAMAHYEPGEVVINLTKTKGAGSLAHEWFHALDNYFQKKRDTLPTTEKGNFITHNPETYYIGPRGYSVPESRFKDMRGINKNEWRRVEGVRPEVAVSFKNLVDTLNGLDFAKRSSRLDKGKAGGYWSSNLEMAARAFESYVKAKMSANGYDNDFLANVTSATDFVRDDSRYPYIKADEIAEVEAAFDDLFNTIESKENDSGDVALFSVAGTVTGNANTRTVSRSNANEIVSRFVKGLTSAGKNYVSVVSSYDDLPTEIKDAAKAQGVEYQVKGVFHKGKVHVVLDQHTSALDMETTLFHEAYGHLGIKNLFGDDITKKLNSLFIANGGLKGLRETAKRHGINLEKYIKGLDKTNMPQEMKNRVLMDELLAHMQQRNKPSVKRLAREIVGMIREGLRKLGLPGLSKVTDSDLFYVLKQARAAAKNGPSQSPAETLFRTTDDAAPFTMPEETWTDNALRFIQDKFNRVKRAQDTIRKAGIDISDSADVYGVESLYYGKVEEDFRQLAEKYLEPMAEKMAKHNIKQEELDLFLYALHAPERNAHIHSMDEEMTAGSGMTDDEARRILDAVNRDPRRRIYNELQQSVREMIDERTQQMFEQGLIDEETFSGFQDNYQYYVPLKGQAKDEGGKPKGTGMGFNIKGKESIAALGRKSRAESPLLHAYLDTQKAITRGHKNEVGNALLNLIEEAPNPELWSAYTTEGPLERKKGPDGKIKMVPMSKEKMSALSSNPQSEWFATKRDGMEYYIKIDDPVLAMQMKNVGVDNGNRITQALGTVNRFLSMMATSANPEFLITNVTRDVQTALYNLAAESDVDDGKLKGVDVKAL